MTEMKLKTDVLVSTNDSLVTDKGHLTGELKDIRNIMRSYEAKSNSLLAELT